MKIKSATFQLSAADISACPAWAWREFAFVGRSNVGKSSLINMLCGKANLAKVSALPGKTQLLNFFLMNEAWSLVDLPGYGFAQVTKQRKYDFSVLISEYLEQRTNLARVFVLIDSRHPPQRIDVDFIAWLGTTGVAFSVVFTKTDKQSAAKTRSNITLFQASVAPQLAAESALLASSTKTRAGRAEILRTIDQALSV